MNDSIIGTKVKPGPSFDFESFRGPANEYDVGEIVRVQTEPDCHFEEMTYTGVVWVKWGTSGEESDHTFGDLKGYTPTDPEGPTFPELFEVVPAE